MANLSLIAVVVATVLAGCLAAIRGSAIGLGALPLLGAAAVYLTYVCTNQDKIISERASQTIQAPTGAFVVIFIAYCMGPLIALSVAYPGNDLVTYALLRVYRPGGAISGLGVAMAAAGLALFLCSKIALGQSYSPCYAASVPTALKCHGPYSLIRHPIYTANLTLLSAGVLVSGSGIVLLVLAALFVVYQKAAALEEQALSNELPGYAAYMQQTGRFLPSWNSLRFATPAKLE